jgi:drug/metabolite transporter (DMT)-like permease
MQPVLMGFLAPLLLGEKNNWLQWAGIAVGFVGVIIFIGADQRAT